VADLAFRPPTYWPGGAEPVFVEPAGDLPPLQPLEVEIARIEVASGELVSVRAEDVGAQIRYRVVDEFGDEGSSFVVPHEYSNDPLTLGELVELIDGTRQTWAGEQTLTGLVDGFRAFYADDVDADELRTLVHLRSAFYPELDAHYAATPPG
jgi:hypothetical protein